ncbi:MAG: Gfo/Idh/MocA family oxidoreductase [Burkholderiales bacterium]|nr:Gfo/Idh/MocA family oxidoreductase [Burkholderiales bacterium]
MSFRAAIAGCGLIGSEFSDSMLLPGVWSHAEAYFACKSIELVAACDADPERVEKCAKRWGVRGYPDFAGMLESENPEIVSICTPDGTHFEMIGQAIRHPSVRAVLAEKPLSTGISQAEEIVALAESRGVFLAVNYTRRYCPGFDRLRKLIALGQLGDIQTVSGHYTKGALHNGSHWFDLAHFLIGPIRSVTGFDRLHESGPDPTLDALLEFEGGASGFLHSCDAAAYAIFEMDIIGSKGRAKIVDSGFRIEIQRVGASPFGAGYRRLEPAESFPGEIGQALPQAVEDLVGCIETGKAPRCSGRDALHAASVSLAAIESASGGMRIGLKT